MQQLPQQQQYSTAQQLGNAELWEALQRQQHAAPPAVPMNGGLGHTAPLMHGPGAGAGMQPVLHSYAVPNGAGQAAATQPMILSGKPLAFTGRSHYGSGVAGMVPTGATDGITGVPSSLTSLPGAPMGSSTEPAPAHLYGSSSSPTLGMALNMQQQMPGMPQQQYQAAGPAVGGGSGYPQLSGLSSQLSSGMLSGGTAPGPAQLMPTMQPLQLSGSALASAAHLPPPALMHHAQQPHAGMPLPIPMPINTHARHAVKLEPEDPSHPSSSHSAVAMPLAMPDSPHGGIGSDDGEGEADGSPTDCMGSGGLNKSRYRGVSYDRKKAKWRVQIKVAALGKSGVSVGYFDTEEAAARAYDRAAIGLLGRDNPNLQTNFDARDYTGETIPPLTGKTREEVKTTLKSERIKQAPRRRFTSRQRTSRFMGVGSSNRKNQWQARILVHGKVTHLGYYETEEEAARVYDKVSLALHGDNAQTNFPPSNYRPEEVAVYSGLDRENLQRALGVKPMDKSSKFRGVSKKKGKWEAKVMVNRRWAYRELFDSEEEAARAYDRALWRLKPKEAHSYVNFKDEVPPEVAHLLGHAGGEEGIPGGAGAGGGASHHRSHRGGPLGSSDDEEEASDGSEGLSDEDGSGGTPQPPSWMQRTSRSGRRLRATGPGPAGSPASAPAVAMLQAQQGGMGRVASAPNLHSQAAAAAAVAPLPLPVPSQPPQQQAVAPPAMLPAPAGAGQPPASMPMMPAAGQPSFVALPGGGLQLQFGGSAPAAVEPARMFAPVPPAASSALDSQQPLLVRVGSETHLIPQRQQPVGPAGGAAATAAGQQQVVAGLGGSTLGKRMSRIQSEPVFNFKDDLSGSGPELGDLMNDRDLFKAFDLGGLQEGAGTSGTGGSSGHSAGGAGANGGSTTPGLDLDLDTSELLDFIKDMPDVAPVGLGGGGIAGASASRAGMFKSRSMGNLMDLSAPFFDEEDEALASMEYARPRKMSKSMSMNQLAGLEAQQGGGLGEAGAGSGSGGGSSGRPPLPPNGSSDSKLGPLGKPIRRTNTFSSSLAVLQEADREGRGADDANALQGIGGGAGGMSSHHSSGDDLVQRLLAPAPPQDDEINLLM